jgi:hypothetical protein
VGKAQTGRIGERDKPTSRNKGHKGIGVIRDKLISGIRHAGNLSGCYRQPRNLATSLSHRAHQQSLLISGRSRRACRRSWS